MLIEVMTVFRSRGETFIRRFRGIGTESTIDSVSAMSYALGRMAGGSDGADLLLSVPFERTVRCQGSRGKGVRITANAVQENGRFKVETIEVDNVFLRSA